MAKIIVEIADELKQKFRVTCAKEDLYQKTVITYLIENWLRKKRSK